MEESAIGEAGPSKGRFTPESRHPFRNSGVARPSIRHDPQTGQSCDSGATLPRLRRLDRVLARRAIGGSSANAPGRFQAVVRERMRGSGIESVGESTRASRASERRPTAYREAVSSNASHRPMRAAIAVCASTTLAC